MSYISKCNVDDVYISDTGLEKMFKELDINGDNKVSMAELKEYAKRKESLRKKHILDKQLTIENQTTTYVNEIFTELGKWICLRH